MRVNGKLSFDGAYSLGEGIFRNKSLENVNLSVNGELPINWQAVGENLHPKLAEKGFVSTTYPKAFSTVKRLSGDTFESHTVVKDSFSAAKCYSKCFWVS